MAAEAVISFVIERLGDLIIQKIVQLKGIEGQVEKLRDVLVRMRCFLKDADQKQDEDERIRNWVSEIRCAAYDAEDVIEIFIHKVESFQKNGFLRRVFYKPMQWSYLNKIGKEIESIQLKIKDVAESREQYGIGNLGEGTSTTRRQELQRLRRSFPFDEEKDVVGLEEKAKHLVAQLLKEDRDRRVVSIIGMGGVGKTTLAKKVYNNADVRERFDSRAWVCVSQSYNFRGLLQTILKQVKGVDNELMEKLSEEDLVEMLYTELQNKCYLVVLDDIWKEEDWDCLSKAFPDSRKACRFLLTSRNREVPVHADAVSIPYELKPLEPKDSWQLFLKRAICADELNAPSDLEAIGQEITRRCAGLPLAIKVIGGILLGKKKLKSEWERVLHNLSTYLSKYQNGVSAILESSYADLSPHLKLCFQHLGLFPEDYEISVRRLFHMWISEGLIQNTDTMYLEEIAEDYLNQLINRNLVQVAFMSYHLKVKRCRLHDLVLELAKNKAKDNLFQINRLQDFEASAQSRYAAIHCHHENHSSFSSRSILRLRSPLFIETSSYKSKISLDLRNFRLLRMLDLEDMNIKRLPEETGKLILLRYLNLRNTGIEKLPQSLRMLRNLQTLDISTCPNLKLVSNRICNLENLQHLYVDRGFQVPLKEIRKLQTLSILDLHYVTYDDLLGLRCLRQLKILVDQDSKIDELCFSLAKLRNFRSLSMRGDPPSLAGLSILVKLTELKLSCSSLNMLPDLPPDISSLCLKCTNIAEDPIPTLGKLKQLSFLKLECVCYCGDQMSIPKNGFLQLKSLELESFPMKEIKIEKGALQELRWLRIIGCSELKMLPEEVKHMSALQKLELVKMPDSFVRRVFGEDSYKVCHVACVSSLQHKANELIERKLLIEKIIAHAQIIRAAASLHLNLISEDETAIREEQRPEINN